MSGKKQKLSHPQDDATHLELANNNQVIADDALLELDHLIQAVKNPDGEITLTPQEQQYLDNQKKYPEIIGFVKQLADATMKEVVSSELSEQLIVAVVFQHTLALRVLLDRNPHIKPDTKIVNIVNVEEDELTFNLLEISAILPTSESLLQLLLNYNKSLPENEFSKLLELSTTAIRDNPTVLLKDEYVSRFKSTVRYLCSNMIYYNKPLQDNNGVMILLASCKDTNNVLMSIFQQLVDCGISPWKKFVKLSDPRFLSESLWLPIEFMSAHAVFPHKQFSAISILENDNPTLLQVLQVSRQQQLNTHVLLNGILAGYIEDNAASNDNDNDDHDDNDDVIKSRQDTINGVGILRKLPSDLKRLCFYYANISTKETESEYKRVDRIFSDIERKRAENNQDRFTATALYKGK